MEDERARDNDRDAAIEVVEAAWADGQIIEADRDKRVEQLRMAQTLAEIRMITHDLHPPSGPAVPVPSPVAVPAPPVVDYGPPSPAAGTSYPTLDQVTATPPGKVSRIACLIPLAVVLVIAVASISGIVALVGGIGDAIDTGSIGGEEADVLSVGGYRALLTAVEEETGSTVAFSAVLYPTYGSVELPVDRTSQRAAYWSWDGSVLTNNDSKTTSSFRRTDLSRVDPAVIVDLVEKVQKNVEDPTSYYAIVRAPDDDRAVIWAYASNEYGESEYLGARRDGTITYDSTDY